MNFHFAKLEPNAEAEAFANQHLANRIAAFLENKSGVEINGQKVEDCGDGLKMFVGTYVDRVGGDVSMGFAFPLDRADEIMGLIAITLRDYR